MNAVELLRQKIENEEVTAYKVAKAINTNPSVITRILSGETKNPNPETLRKLETYLLANNETYSFVAESSIPYNSKDLTMNLEDLQNYLRLLKKENEELRISNAELRLEIQKLKKYTDDVRSDY
ncbi:helix-turn-helix domain-containing protein [Leadbetterella byssophila]|uniref:helix-turn-helix domain-containing protein n=1 Tax=Leadbetterella byssophila TaxID=316068 RepID=UPI0039A16919